MSGYVPKVKVLAGGKETIFSQVLHLIGDSSFKIYIEEWYCVVNFKTDEGKARFVGRIEDSIQQIDFYNHESTTGLSISEPFSIASAGEIGTIYMSYYTVMLTEKPKSRRFEFTLWVDAK